MRLTQGQILQQTVMAVVDRYDYCFKHESIKPVNEKKMKYIRIYVFWKWEKNSNVEQYVIWWQQSVQVLIVKKCKLLDMDILAIKHLGKP